jgi:hypothetical protein
MRIEGECYFHMPPGALLKVISFALYKHVCITFQPTLVVTSFWATVIINFRSITIGLPLTLLTLYIP